LCIDVSGSMKGEPIAAAKRAANRFLDQLDKEDFTSLIAFGSSVRLLTEFTQNRTEVREQIEALAATEQWTWLYQATQEAVEKAAKAPTSRAAVILLTDGKDEGSPATEAGVLGRAEGARIPVYTLGFGQNAPVDYLQRVAGISEGRFWYTPRAEQLPELYSAVLEQLKNQYAIRFPFAQPSGEYKSEVTLRYQGWEVPAQRAFLHASPEPPSWWREFPVHPALLAVIAGFMAVIVVVVVFRRPSPAAAVASAAADSTEPQASLMLAGEVHPLGVPWKKGTDAMTVLLQTAPGEVGLKIGLMPVPLYFALLDSQEGKQYKDVTVSRHDPKRPFCKDTTYLLLSHPTVHRPDETTSGHARIFMDEATGRFQVQDLGSNLTTKLNDAICRETMPLEDGDVITLGGISMSYYDKRAPSEVSSF